MLRSMTKKKHNKMKRIVNITSDHKLAKKQVTFEEISEEFKVILEL